MIEKIRTVIWFIKRPSFYLHLLVLIRERIFPSPKENTSVEATQWCQQHARSTDEFLNNIGVNAPVDVMNEFKQEILDAERTVNNVPLKMGLGGAVSLLYNLAEHVGAMRIIETGISYGWSSLFFLYSLNKREGSTLISTDMPYPKMDNESYVGIVVPENLRYNWQILRSPDRSALPGAIRSLGSIDVCHYDSDKTYRGRMWAYPRLWRALRPGGIFISDDIGDNIAFMEFAIDVGAEPHVVEFDGKYIGIIEKN